MKGWPTSYDVLQDQTFIWGLSPSNILSSVGMEADSDDIQAEPEQPRRDNSKDQGEKLVEINLATQSEESQPIFISTNLQAELRHALLNRLQKFKNALARTYAQMPGLDPHLITHRLNIKEGTKPVD